MLLRKFAVVDVDAGFTCRRLRNKRRAAGHGNATFVRLVGRRRRGLAVPAEAGPSVGCRPVLSSTTTARLATSKRAGVGRTAFLHHAGQVVHLLKHQRLRTFADEFRLPLVLLPSEASPRRGDDGTMNESTLERARGRGARSRSASADYSSVAPQMERRC